MADLFQRGLTYDNDGRAYITGDWINLVYQSPFETSATSGVNQTGTISDAYDFGSANYVNFNWVAASGIKTLTWDLGEKRKVKAIVLSCAAVGTQATTYSVKIQGSNDDSTYDDLDTESGSKAAGSTEFLDLSAVEQNYRYIRIELSSVQTASASSSGFDIYNVGIYI